MTHSRHAKSQRSSAWRPFILCCATLLVLPTNTGFAQEAGKLHLKSDGETVVTYNADYVPSPDKDAPYYGRSGFIHPFRTPSGRVVTDGFPADHMHQHGLMFAWTKAKFDGHAVDFWNQKSQLGHVEHIETVQASDDRIIVRLQHGDDVSEPAVVVLQETWEIVHVPAMKIDPSLAEHVHIFDLTSTQTNVTEKPLLLPEYHYGGMCVRGPEAWAKKAGTMLTSEGKGRIDGNHTRPNWAAITGKREGELCGIAAMSHPSNFRSPQPVRLHPSLAYFCFAPMVLGDFTIEPKSPYVSRFRFVAYDGAADASQLDLIWDAFQLAQKEAPN
ncbi:MAG: PmoA family protein [Rubripirellula sp.]